MNIDEALAEIRSAVPADWQVWTNKAGAFDQFDVIAVKGMHDGEMYGCVHRVAEASPGKFRDWAREQFGPILEQTC